jgi:hypothetical protein
MAELAGSRAATRDAVGGREASIVAGEAGGARFGVRAGAGGAGA